MTRMVEIKPKSNRSLPMIHLIVFVHGFEGTGHDFDNAELAIKSTFRELGENVETFKVQANSNFGGTYDGIENGATRVWKDIMKRVKLLGGLLAKISIIGHSLGGLYARYLLRLLDDCFLFDHVEPHFFITLATPHLSVRRMQSYPLDRAFQAIAQRVCQTTKELCLEDNPINPILYRMTDKSFLQVLGKFRHRILYSNVRNDFQVPYSTSSISIENPYVADTSKCLKSSKYSDLTVWSLENVINRLQLDIERVDDFAKGDSRARLLRAMFIRLNELEWERFDCIFPTVFAHEQIINKRSLFPGKDVIRHLCERIAHHHIDRYGVPEHGNHMNNVSSI